MYNGHHIKQLLVERKIQNKDLLAYLGYTTNASLKQITDGNPSVTRLEKVADFFDVSMDVFFDREKPFITVQEVHNSTIQQLQEKVNLLEKLIEEKDKRISLLERMTKILHNQDK